MVKFQVRANPSGQYYFPKEVREELGRKLDLICNAKTAVIFNAETSLDTVLQSLEIIQKDLQHRLHLQKEQQNRFAE
jgi:bifunctional DNA-binding transcriptional regulator/antitoxin component of YhaV-PrlF toxin-antitoxin module